MKKEKKQVLKPLYVKGLAEMINASQETRGQSQHKVLRDASVWSQG